MTSIELERLLSESGPTQGKLLRPGDQKAPKSVAFLQCVGSRDMKRKYCSYACCMYALKEATLIKKLHPETEVEIFYMDMRTFGKGYYRYYQQAVQMGVKFTRSRVPLVKQDFKNGDLLITVAGEDGKLAQRRLGMLVLSVGQTPSPHFKQLAECVGVRLSENGFCEIHELTPVETNKPGVFVCGSASGPKDITDSMIRASAAAGRAARFALPVQRGGSCRRCRRGTSAEDGRLPVRLRQGGGLDHRHEGPGGGLQSHAQRCLRGTDSLSVPERRREGHQGQDGPAEGQPRGAGHLRAVHIEKAGIRNRY